MSSPTAARSSPATRCRSRSSSSTRCRSRTSARSCGANCARWPEEREMPTPARYTTATLRDFVGHDFGASAPVTIGQPRIDGFAEVTGDHQWIHVDVERARAESPFGGPVAHGFLTLSLLAAAITEAGVVPADAKGVVNYGLDKIRFL